MVNVNQYANVNQYQLMLKRDIKIKNALLVNKRTFFASGDDDQHMQS